MVTIVLLNVARMWATPRYALADPLLLLPRLAADR